MTTPNRDQVTEEQLAALEVLRTGSRFVLVGHMRPDGDCIGAQAALARGLMSLGKEVRIVNPDQPGPEFTYLYEECPFGVFDGDGLPANDVIVLLDFNELSRTGAMAEHIAKLSSKKIVIDHHPFSGDPWWDAAYVDVTASATGILIWRILHQLEAEVGKTAAAGVFTSMVTDTGWFRYSNTDAETLQTAADILKRGVDPSSVFASIYQCRPTTEPQAIAALLERSEFHGDGRLAIVDHPLESGAANLLADSDPVLDILRSVGSVEVVIYLKEIKPGMCKLSARSKTGYDVNRLAREFGGGGHVKASGATIMGELSEVKERLLEAALRGF